MFRDFKYKLVKVPKSPGVDVKSKKTSDADPRFDEVVLSREDDRPLVFLFGWAGASEKNLGKYADIYHQVT